MEASSISSLSTKMIFILKLPCVIAGLSEELQTVLRMMLAPEPSERPTVSELLALPSVRKRRWRRRIYLMAAETMLTLASLCQVTEPINPLNVNLLGLFILINSLVKYP